MEFKIEENRIYADDSGGKTIAEVTFPEAKPGVVDINRTFVDPSLRGQGVAGQLMEAAFKKIASDGKKAILSCPYAVRWASENTDYEALTYQEGV